MSERKLCIVATRQEIHLQTNPVFPPIPTRRYDWSAIDANTYDVDYDYEIGYYSRSEQGHGATEQEAIADLIEQLEERE